MYPIETPDKIFHDGDGVSELGTILPAWWLNQIQGELLGVLELVSIAPNKTNTKQLKTAIDKLFTTKAAEATAAKADTKKLTTEDLNSITFPGIYGQRLNVKPKTRWNTTTAAAGRQTLMSSPPPNLRRLPNEYSTHLSSPLSRPPQRQRLARMVCKGDRLAHPCSHTRTIQPLRDCSARASAGIGLYLLLRLHPGRRRTL